VPSLDKHIWVLCAPILTAVWKPEMQVPYIRWRGDGRKFLPVLASELAQWVHKCRSEAAEIAKENENVDM
jgi:hypothetical protein